MVNWSAHEQEIIQQSIGKDYRTFLNEIPENERKWKCYTCYTILKNSELIDHKCPSCGEVHLERVCPIDHNGCGHSIVERIEFCPVCNKALCPECGDHSVLQISRVTGYLQDVSGFNSSKKQELRDRVRGNLGNDGQIHRVHS